MACFIFKGCIAYLITYFLYVLLYTQQINAQWKSYTLKKKFLGNRLTAKYMDVVVSSYNFRRR